ADDQNTSPYGDRRGHIPRGLVPNGTRQQRRPGVHPLAGNLVALTLSGGYGETGNYTIGSGVQLRVGDHNARKSDHGKTGCGIAGEHQRVTSRRWHGRALASAPQAAPRARGWDVDRSPCTATALARRADLIRVRW